MQIIAISPDETEESIAFAKRYDIRFPLVSDEDLAIARQYVGVDDNGFPRPGVVVIRRDGTIHLRQIARNKHDRIYAAKLVSILDSLPGQSAARSGAKGPGLRGGYAAITRRELAVGVAGGAVRSAGGGTADDAAGRLSLGLVQPLGAHLGVGLGAGLDIGGGTLAHAGVLLRVRRPTWGRQGSVYGQVSFGGAVDLNRAAVPTASRFGAVAGAALGFHFAWYPGLAFLVQLSGDRMWFSGLDGAPDTRRTTVSLGGGVMVLF